MTTIRIIDFETTGTEPPAEVVEVGYCDLIRGEDGTWSVGQPVSWLCGVEAIPAETRAVHHISLQDVADKPAYDPIALLEASEHCAVIAAHNASFEEQWLDVAGRPPLLCTYKAALRVWPDAPSHSNSVLRYWLEDQGLLSLNHDTAMPPNALASLLPMVPAAPFRTETGISAMWRPARSMAATSAGYWSARD